MLCSFKRLFDTAFKGRWVPVGESGGACGKKCCEKGMPPIELKASTAGWLPQMPARSLRGCAAVYLTGTYDRNLDAKGRLSLPPAFRKQLDEHVRVLPAPEKEVDALYVFTEDTFKAWLDSVFEAKGGFDPTNRAHRVVKETLNGAATTLEIDSAARISLPEPARAKAHLDREVTVVGNGDRLVVWDRATHEARCADAESILADFFD